MSSDENERPPSGFVDAVPTDEGPDTVFVPAFDSNQVTSPEVEVESTQLVPAHDAVKAYLDDGEPIPAPPVEVLPPEAPDGVDVSDLEWWGDEQVSPNWDGDAPLAAPLDAPKLPRSAPLTHAIGEALELDRPRNDVFERRDKPAPMRAGLERRAPPVRSSSSPRHSTPPPPSITVADLARRAEKARASASSYSPPSPDRRPGPSPTRARGAPPPLPGARRSRRVEQTEPEVPVYKAPPPVSQPAPAPSGPPPKRAYPKMLALLTSSEAVPHGDAPIPPPRPPAVPGTFFPAKSHKEVVDDTPDVDTLLQAMAEGLLVGGDGDSGSSQIMITLRDEFFAGTQLRVGITEGGIEATLVPPDRGTYRHLCSEIHRLESRLSRRGRRVSTLRVEDP